MRTKLREWTNHSFTTLSSMTILLMAAALLLFLLPMFSKGLTAVFFGGTVEFRKMQAELFKRGNPETLQREMDSTQQARAEIFALLERFSRGIDTAQLESDAKTLFRQYGDELRFRNVPTEKFIELRQEARRVRDRLIEAYENTDKDEVLPILEEITNLGSSPQFVGTSMETLIAMAGDYRAAIRGVDLTRRPEYAAALEAVKEQLRWLFGPLPGESIPALAMYRFGATRRDMMEKHIRYLIWQERWIEQEPGKPLVKTLVRRDDPETGVFAGTELVPLFALVEENADAMLNPRFTFYWQYFIDDSTPGHYFGGVGPEILGTLLLTLLAILFAVPPGIISAAYLVEYAGDNVVIKVIRTCINTLAGVPSIVYGLFGLAFFVTVVGHPSILTASMTLALLILPVVIRASEEAIRSVPQTYREASLALGSGKFRTFTSVTLPAAGPGILTGIILSLSRAAGETAPILFAGAVALGPIPDFTGKWWLQPSRALSYGCYDITVGDKLAMMVPHNQFGMVMTLILLVLTLNITAIVIRSHMSRKLRGS
ncbi:MAG: phosphate ABC transporter permease PstA [Phycisphaerae bacterium]|nr:phosphate ABC transporter permease PstA [Phycisphaerae bacterium]